MTRHIPDPTPARLAFLRERALRREAARRALRAGYAIDPEYWRAAGRELLWRDLLGWAGRRPKHHEFIIAVPASFAQEHLDKGTDPHDIWGAAQALT